jgi:hypothetical protein
MHHLDRPSFEAGYRAALQQLAPKQVQPTKRAKHAKAKHQPTKRLRITRRDVWLLLVALAAFLLFFGLGLFLE